MASFPDLRPNRRSAKAESTAAPGNRARLLLAVSTALLLTASLAVSELATLRGARAHDASVFLTRELGPPLDRPLVRTPARADTQARQARPRREARDPRRRPQGHVGSRQCLAQLRQGPGRVARAPARCPAEAAVRQRGDRARVEPRRAVADRRQASGHPHVALAPRCGQAGSAAHGRRHRSFRRRQEGLGAADPPGRRLRQEWQGHHSAGTALVPRTSRQDTMAAAPTERRGPSAAVRHRSDRARRRLPGRRLRQLDGHERDVR